MSFRNTGGDPLRDGEKNFQRKVLNLQMLKKIVTSGIHNDYKKKLSHYGSH